MAVKKKSAKPKSAAAKASKKTAPRRASTQSARTTGAKKTTSAKKGGDALSFDSISPALTVNDVETSLTWYRDVVGFAMKERWERDGKLLGVQLDAGKSSFMLGQDDWKKGRDRIKGQGVRLYCFTTQDIDRLAARIKSKGGRLTQEPTDQAWGMRDITIDDPDGYKITIAAMLKKKKK